MRFTKMQGAGNDFILIETDDMQRDWSALALAMCDRHYGIGADGLLLLLPSDKADCQMRIIDCDGTEAEACGNGLRCLVKYFVDGRLNGFGVPEISVETRAGIRRANIYRADGVLTRVQTSMGAPKFGSRDIPVVLDDSSESEGDTKSILTRSVTVAGTELPLSFVSMGNPHAVCFLETPVADFPLSRLGPKVERLPIFPNRVNFEIARVLNRRQIEARVWERGVGETLACGSGACAVNVAAQLQGYTGNDTEIKLAGGVLEVEWDGTGEVFLSGPAETVFRGEWPEEYLYRETMQEECRGEGDNLS